MTRQVDDHLIEVTLTTLVAWGSFLIAEELHVSGVLSTVSAGILMGSFGKYFGMSASTRVAVQDFWQYMGFLSNSFIFLLVGLELDPGAFITNLPVVLIAFFAVLAARGVAVYAGIPLVDLFSVPLPSLWKHVLAWGGLRGSLSMVLILGLPLDFAGRSFLINLVFGVVSVSLFLQGLTMAPFMKRLQLTQESTDTNHEYEIARGRSLSYRQVIYETKNLIDRGVPDEASYRQVLQYYDEAREKALSDIAKYAATKAHPERLHEAAKSMAVIEREAISHALATEMISAGTCADLLNDLNVRLDELETAAQDSEEKMHETFQRLYSNLSDTDEKE
jgi:CPA1 family monovalent cation:H+ antiporter